MPQRFPLIAFAALLLATIAAPPALAQSIVPDLEREIRQRASEIEGKLIAWRRDIHQHPELGEQETRTAGLVADHLRKLGLEVKTGVVALLNAWRGSLPARPCPPHFAS